MNQSTAKKFGFWSALAMVIGSVVGIGIFFKNESIFAATNGNDLSTLLAWIFGGVISLFCALSFAEISKSSTDTNGGFGEYSRVYIGKRFSNFVKVNYTFLYFGIISPALSYFTYIFLTMALGGGVSNMGIFLAIIIGPLLSLAINLYFPGLQKATFTVSVVIKFLPLLLAALSGLWFTKNNGGISTETSSFQYVFTQVANGTPGAVWLPQAGQVALPPSYPAGWYLVTRSATHFTTKETFKYMLAAMPMVLFAYDAFISVGSIAKDTKNSEKNIPLAIGAGMVFVAILYTLVTISQLMQNQGSVSDSIASAIGTNAFSSVINFIIVISACGTTLSAITAGTYITKDLIESDTLAFSKSFAKRFKSTDQAAGALFSTISLVFGLLFFMVSVSVGGKVDMLDEMSNLPTLFFFVLYAIVMVGFAIKKIKQSKGKNNKYNIYLITITIIGTIGIALVVGYQFYALIEAMVTSGFATDKKTMIKNVSLILYLVLFLKFPFINAYIKNRYEHKLSYKDTLYNTMLVDLEGKVLLKKEPKVKKVKVKKEKTSKPKKVKVKKEKTPKPTKVKKTNKKK